MSGSSTFRKAGVLIAGGGVYASASYMAYHYYQLNNQAAAAAVSTTGTADASSPLLSNNSNINNTNNTNNTKSNNFSFTSNPARNQQYQKIADFYDDRIGRDEFFMGINLLRRSLLYWHCTGTVLEVGAGTGRNLKYYIPLFKSADVDRVVLMDQSDQMLAQAKEKIAAFGDSDTALQQKRKFACIEGDATHTKLPDHSFDTVVDTFGLCSYNDPVAVLQEMARVCKPTGKILLLEHGRSDTWEWMTKHLDQHAETHAQNWGCVWNRDMDALLQQSGLQVERRQTWHFGTTYYLVCRPQNTSASQGTDQTTV
jgi:methyltransferase OMS1